MTNHPNRNWRRRWVVDLAAQTATHESGLVVKFTGQDGEVIVGIETLRPDNAARLMREAGEVYARKLAEKADE